MRARHDVGHGADAEPASCARRRACPPSLAGRCCAVLPVAGLYPRPNTSGHSPDLAVILLKLGRQAPRPRRQATPAAVYARILTAADTESGGADDIRNGGARFSDYSHFPEGIGPGGTSTAAGAYQFTAETWKEEAARLGLRDMTRANQDKAAWDLAERRYRAQTGRDLETDLEAGNRQARIAAALGPTWPSLPGGSQSHETQDQFNVALARNTAAAAAGQPASAPSHGALVAQRRSASPPPRLSTAPGGRDRLDPRRGACGLPRARQYRAVVSCP